MLTDKTPIWVLSESERAENSGQSNGEVVSLELDYLDEPLHFCIGVAQEQARLADIVPPARTVSTKLALAMLEKLRRDGKTVPCCKGCSACCSFLIPLSVPEVFRLRQEVLAMPASRGGAVLQSCLSAAKRILDNKTSDFNAEELIQINGPTQISRLGKWYTSLKLSCPFLSDGLCTIYLQRPTACREYIVTGSAQLCKAEWTDESQVVPMPINILDALAQLASELEQSSVEAVVLPLALPWSQENLERDRHRWPAITMVERFVEIVKTMALENSTATVEST